MKRSDHKSFYFRKIYREKIIAKICSTRFQEKNSEGENRENFEVKKLNMLDFMISYDYVVLPFIQNICLHVLDH